MQMKTLQMALWTQLFQLLVFLCVRGFICYILLFHLPHPFNDGTYVCPPGTDHYTWDFLKHLQHSPAIDTADQIDTSFTWEDFQAYWKKAKEQTSSSLSTLHFGHYKAVINNDKLSEMHAVFVDIAINSGFSPKRWQKGLTVMLEKKQGVILVNKLCAILLMEADFNFANKTIFGCCMMHFAEDRNDIAGECAGSRQYHEATDVALNHQLFSDIARQKKFLAAITGADLAQCYDRIAHAIASLGSQRWGVPVKGYHLFVDNNTADGFLPLYSTWRL